MALVSGYNLGKSFGAEDIFDGITVSIPYDARIALVGPNGSGKTTLLRLLAMLDTPTEGTVAHSRNLRIGFLPQEADLALYGEGTLWDEMLAVFSHLLAQEARLHEMAEQMASRPDDTTLLETYGVAQQRFEQAGGYEYTARIEQVLGGLGFDEDDFQRPVGQLSGGQKTRALLARLLFEDPDLLILDEPTNHLDIRAIEWLEGFLRSFEGALLIVSHDRYFMDSVVNHVWELVFGRLEEFRGNYSAYLQQREARWDRADELYEREKERLLKEVEYIKRNMGTRGTAQAHGRLKRLTRQLAAIEQVGLVDAIHASGWLELGVGNVRPLSVEEAERRVRSLPRPVKAQRHLSLALRARRRSGDKVLATRELVVGYHDDGIPLFSVPDITLYRGECAALIGPNGAGKTTFLKTVLGQIEPLGGRAVLGASVEVGYFAQAHDGLHPDNTVLDEIMAVKEMLISEARSYLGSFLFSGDDVYKPISVLSGGERGRMALAKLSLGGANLLLLDEPTNHLDIPSQEVIEAVLNGFEGTILLVSHDRFLIRRLATQIWALQVPRRSSDGQAELVVYEGPYDEYVVWREGRVAAAAQLRAAEQQTASRRPRQAPRAAASALSPAEHRRRLAQVEEHIHRLEIDLVNLSGELQAASTAGDVGEVARLGETYNETEARLNALLQEWEDLAVEG
jgi:ATP-binding cassette subfamily F protein 3